MSGTTTIYKQDIEFKNPKTITLTEIISFDNNRLSEELIDFARNRMWCLEGECGAIFEIIGYDIIDKFIDKLKEYDNSISEKSFDEEEIYRVDISY